MTDKSNFFIQIVVNHCCEMEIYVMKMILWVANNLAEGSLAPHHNLVVNF